MAIKVTENITIDDSNNVSGLHAFFTGSVEAGAYGGGGLVPAGTIFFHSSENVPSGFLKCDGSEVSRTTYSILFSIIGTEYGAGDGSTTFNLPEMRGQFVRILDEGAGVDAGRTFGSNQTAIFETHTHEIGASNAPHSHPGSTGTVSVPHTHPASTGGANAPHSHPASTGGRNVPHTHTVNTGTQNMPHTHPVVINSQNEGPFPATYERFARAYNSSRQTMTFGTAAANAPHAHPLSLGGRNVPHAHPFGVGTQNAPHSHPASTGARDVPHIHTVTVNEGGEAASHTHNVLTTPTSGETRPRNFAVMAIIRF